MKKILLTLALLAGSTLLWSNGSPISESSGIATGNSFSLAHSDVDIKKETIIIHIEVNDDLSGVAWVDVKYHMFNPGPAVRVPMAFPVDYYHFEGETQNEADFPVMEFYLADSEDNHYDYQEVEGDQVLIPEPSKWHIDSGMGNQEKVWYKAVLQIPAKQEYTLNIQYSVKLSHSDWEYSGSSLPYYSDRVFLYDLSPAQNWGDGVIDDLEVVIIYPQFSQTGLNLRSNTLPGTELKPGSSLYRKMKDNLEEYTPSYFNFILMHQTGYDCAYGDPIALYFDVSGITMQHFVLERAYTPGSDDKIKASSTLAPQGANTYSTDNLFDQDPATAWVEGAEGTGEGVTITCKFKYPIPLVGLGVLNGYTKSAYIYEINGYVTLLKVEAWGHNSEGAPRKFENEYELDAPEYAGFSPDFYYTYVQYLDGIFADTYPPIQVDQLRLTILNGVGGSKYDDICISELYLIQQPNYDY